MKSQKQRLYDLLPTYIRFRDQQLRDPELGIAPLEALVKALELPLHAIEENIDSLYRGWFIETCDEWKVPYIADLLGVRGLDEAGAMIPSQRSRVANAIAYRRRKGTPAALARAAEDATGWPCYAAELRNLTAVSQTVGAPQPDRGGTIDLRDDAFLGEIGRAFDDHPHTADLRQGRPGRAVPTGSGFQPDNLGLTFWRLESYPMRGIAARPSKTDPDRCFRFHPLGVDTPLFNPPRTPDETVFSAKAPNLPVPLSRQDLAREIAARRRGEDPEHGFMGDPAALRVFVREGDSQAFREIPPQEIEFCDLSIWDDPQPGPDWEKARVAVDPETGRLAFPGPDPSRQVRVEYSYGAASDLGGGPYPRSDRSAGVDRKIWQAVVDRDAAVDQGDDPPRFVSLRDAVDAWHQASRAAVQNAAAQNAGDQNAGDQNADDQNTGDQNIGDQNNSDEGRRGQEKNERFEALIHILGNDLHRIGDLEVALPVDSRLTLQAEERCWPHLQGSLTVRGAAGSRLILDGLGIEGGLTLTHRPSLSLIHCTVHPPAGKSIALDYPPAESGSRRFEVKLDHSILTGSIRLPMPILGLDIADSIVDGDGGPAIRGTEVPDWKGEEPEPWIGPPARIVRSTLFGEVSLLQLWHASNVLFTGRVLVDRPREGEARFCYFPEGSVTLSCRNCLREESAEGGRALRPAFTSATYGQPGYAQLSPCSGPICTGGERGNEMGVFFQLGEGSRMANLNAILDEYLPAGFTPRISFAT